jgi:protein-disulfide isomerase
LPKYKGRNARQASQTPSPMVKARRYLGLGVLLVAGVALVWAIAAFATQGSRGAATPPPALPTVAPTAKPVTQPAGTPLPVTRVDRAKGSPTAKVTMFEYSDFQCPYCAAFVAETYPKLDEAYIKTGKVRLIFRALPLVNLHPQAQKAMETAECAGDQGQFWEMHDLLFGQQVAWAGKANAVEVFKGFAKTLHLDEASFGQCLDGGKYAGLTAINSAEAQSFGIQGTPAFLVGKQLIPGAYPLDTYVKVNEQELAK